VQTGGTQVSMSEDSDSPKPKRRCLKCGIENCEAQIEIGNSDNNLCSTHATDEYNKRLLRAKMQTMENLEKIRSITGDFETQRQSLLAEQQSLQQQVESTGAAFDSAIATIVQFRAQFRQAAGSMTPENRAAAVEQLRQLQANIDAHMGNVMREAGLADDGANA
ncbi:hypothetical protein BOX15_Mlig014589g2, partial [Macrostomum lignano]